MSRAFFMAFKVIAALLLSLVLWEVALRVFLLRPILYRDTAALGQMPKPGSSALWTVEGRGVLHFNELGLRNPPIAPKRAGETRIVAFGDSYTEAYQMPVEKTFPLRLQTLLRQEPAMFSVINAGHNGSAPAYFAALAPQYRRLLKPDWIIVLVHDSDWKQALPRKPGVPSAPRPSESRRHKIMLRLGLESLTITKYLTIRSSFARLARNATPAAQAPDPNAARDENARGFAAMDESLGALQKEFPRLVVVHIPSPSQKDATFAPASVLERRLAGRCRAFGIPLILMRQPILADYARTGWPPFGFANTLPWSGHPNAHGHDLIAQELVKFFSRPQTLPAPKSTPE